MKKIEKKNIEDITLLTPMQEGMLLHHLKEPNSDFYFEQLILNITGEIRSEFYIKAWEFVIQTNEMVRSVFQWERLEKPVRIVLKQIKSDLRFFDYSSIQNPSDRKKQLEKRLHEDRWEKFDLRDVSFRVSLCKTAWNEYSLIMSNHHILLDGWSTGILLNEFFHVYELLIKGDDLGLKAILPAKTPFRDYLQWYWSRDKEKERIFWQAYLDGFNTQTELAIKRNKLETKVIESGSSEFIVEIKKEHFEQIDGFLKENKVTWAAYFYTAWGILLQKYCNKIDVVFGTTVSGRSVPINGIEKMIGLFINTLPLRITSEPHQPVLSMLLEINQFLFKREKNENAPLTDLRRYSQLDSTTKIFDSIMVIENYPVDRLLLGSSDNKTESKSLQVLSYSVYESAPYDLVIAVSIEGGIKIRFIYNGGGFVSEDIKHLSGHFIHILNIISTNPGLEVGRVNILSSDERQRALYEFNRTASEYPRSMAIHRIFNSQVVENPDSIAVIGERIAHLSDHNNLGALTYRELGSKSDQWADYLKKKSLFFDSPIALIIERSLEMLIGILAVLKVGGAYLPIDPGYPYERKNYMLKDSNSSVLLTYTGLTDLDRIDFSGDTILIDVLTSERLSGPVEFPARVKSAEHVAYIMYTSGSTGKPKGVMVEHRNVIRLVINTKFVQLSTNTRILQTGAPVFDATTFEMWGALLNGGQLILVGKDIILDANRLGQALILYDINTLWLSSPLFNQLVQHNSGIFSGLAYLLVGGDVLSPKHINLVRNKYQHLNIINGYGPTENTTFSTTFLIDKDYDTAIPIGRPITNSTAFILNNDGNLQPVGIYGELWVGGDGISRGYLNNPELTSEKFKSDPFLKGNRLYRTGDMARWLEKGIIEYLGRIDHQIKIRGFRIEIGEIETQLLKYEKINEAVVIDRENDSNQKYLCAYLVLDGNSNKETDHTNTIEEIKVYLSKHVPDYMIPSSFIILNKIPLNSNGKVDVNALPEPDYLFKKEYIAPRTEVEKKLVQIWADVLGIAAKKIGITDDFFELGGHSLSITSVIGRVHKALNIQVPFKDFFTYPTISELAEYVTGHDKKSHSSIYSCEEKEYYPLSPAQKRIYVLQQLDTDSVTYNIHGFFLLKGEIEPVRFEDAFNQLIHYHHSLRTSFQPVKNHPVQKIHTNIEFKIEIGNYSSELDYENEELLLNYDSLIKNYIKRFIRSFDLSSAPLIRVGLLPLPSFFDKKSFAPLPQVSSQKEFSGEQCLLLIDMHHIISDGTSMGLMIADFLSIYDGNNLSKSRLQYKDYSQWINSNDLKHIYAKHRAYWLKEFSGEIPTLTLPIDFTRPLVQDFSGAHLHFELGIERALELKKLARDENTTLFGVLIAVFNILLFKLSGQQDILIGTPVANRNHTEISKLVGMFVNTLVLRNNPAGNKSFSYFINEVQNRLVRSFSHQEYPFEQLVEQLALKRDAGRNPLFDVAFAIQNMDELAIEIPGLKIESFPYDNHLSKFDLTFICEQGKDRFGLTVEYCTRLFKEETIKRFVTYFNKIIDEMLEDRNKYLNEFEIISSDERTRILYEFNRFETEFERHKTIQQLFVEQVNCTPGHIAVVARAPQKVMQDSNSISKRRKHYSLTYRGLDQYSDQVAYFLHQKGVSARGLIGIRVERSVEMAVGILGILKAGCAYVPLNPKNPASRNQYILTQCNIHYLLTTHELLEIPQNEIFLQSLELIDIFNCLNFSGSFQSPANFEQIRDVDLAYVIFTSGSSGLPKGVPITHTNFCQLIHWGYRHLGITSTDRTLQNLSYYFDWSVWEIFITLTTGAGLYMVPEVELMEPDVCTELIAIFGITILHVTPTQYSYIVNTGKHTSSLRYLFIGAEKLTYDLVQRSLAVVSPYCRVFNMYGPTEATIISAVLEINRSEYHCFAEMSSIPIGRPAGNVQLLIMDSFLNLCPVNVVGELIISGDGLSNGYLNDPQLTSERFLTGRWNCLRLFSKREKKFTRHSKLYKTGDLARWLPDGNIHYIGRIDHQVKIRGFRIELGEIENQLLTHENILDVVVIDRAGTGSGEKVLCAYFVSKAPMDSKILRHYLTQFFPEYMIPAFFIMIDNIPINPNGKVDRDALPEPDYRSVSVTVVPPRNSLDQQLIEIWADVLGKDRSCSQQGIGIEDNFFDLGGHSLKATQLVSRIRQELNVSVPLVELFKTPFIRDISEFIENASKQWFSSINPVEKREYYNLSSAQKRLYVLHQLGQDNTIYNIPIFLKLEGRIDKKRFQEIFTALIRRHESLRTSFRLIDKVPLQHIHDNVEFSVTFSGFNNDSLDSQPVLEPDTFIRPFDLSHAPLLRVGVKQLAEQFCLLMLDFHHIITDGMSVNVLIEDFSRLFAGQSLTDLKLQYKDYVIWRDSQKDNESFKKQALYWQSRFQGDLPVLELPTDFVRPKTQSFSGSSFSFEISSIETDRLKSLALETGTTVYMVLLALYSIFLAKISNQETITIGTALSGRRHAQLESIIGMFVNTLVLSLFPRAHADFLCFLKDVSAQTVQDFENQEYPFEELVEAVDIKRNPNRNPLFDVFFDLQPVSPDSIKIPGVKVSSYYYNLNISKFDLMLQALEGEKNLLFIFEYSTALFKATTMRRFSEYFKQVIRVVLDRPEIRLSQLEIISEEDRTQILFNFNDTGVEYPQNERIHTLFQTEVINSPNALAVVFEENSLSYNELNRRSDQLAEMIRNKGIQPGAPVGLLRELGMDAIIAVIAILKAMAAYLPIDPGYPQDRINYILADSNAAMVITCDMLSSFDYRSYSTHASYVRKESGYCLAHTHLLAYIMYTSGSTGRPKGVLVEHRNVVRLVKNTNFIRFKSGDRILQTGALEFDASTFEIWGGLLNGLTLYLTPKHTILNPEILKGVIRRNSITTMWMTSPLFNQMVQSDIDIFSGLHNLLVGGDALSPVHINQVKRRFPLLNLINGYGPTENTTFSTTFLIDKEYSDSIPIGKPIANSTSYIVDQTGHLQPIGIVGELLVGGDGVSCGYVNNPELTEEKFIKLVTGVGNGLEREKHSLFTINFLGGSGGRFFKKAPMAVGDKLYKTGDLARWQGDGNIQFLGRYDQQVKIRGFRVEPGEIESYLLSHEPVYDAIVQIRTDASGEKYLCAYVVLEEELFLNQLKERLTGELPKYMIPSYFVTLERIPLTANGKVDWRALPDPEIKGPSDKSPGPRDEIEIKLIAVWAEVLGVSPDRLHLDSDFFELGGHSLKATLLLSKIHKVFSINIPLMEIFTSSTVRELALLIKCSLRENYVPVKPQEKKEYYDLSSAQKRLYILQQMDIGGIGYNIPYAFICEGNVDLNQIERVFKQLIQRHESLRTSFPVRDGNPVQRVYDTVEFAVEKFNIDSLVSKKTAQQTGYDLLITRFVRPFDLSGAPLIRVGLSCLNCFDEPPREETTFHRYLLLIDMHHIISDGFSMKVLVNDFIGLYQGEIFYDIKAQYTDFIVWQANRLEDGLLEQQKEFWQSEFFGEIPKLEIPLDFQRPRVQQFEGRHLEFSVNALVSARLNLLALDHDVTLFMVLLSIYSIFLSKLSSQEDIVVGTPVAGRQHADLEPIIGMFVNTLALRNFPIGELTLKQFLLRVKHNVLKGFANQDYSYEDLVKDVDVDRDTGRNPLFDTMFVLQNLDIPGVEIPGLKLEPAHFETGISKFDLSLYATESLDGLLFTFEYNRKLFEENTIKRFIDYFLRILDKVLKNPAGKIYEIELISGDQRKQILEEFNSKDSSVPVENTIMELFSSQAKVTPHTIAVVDRERQLSYRQMDIRTTQKAAGLKAMGVDANHLVALFVERSLELVEGVFSILKAGGAYLPIDLITPLERIKYIIKDSSVDILLFKTSFISGLETGCRCFDLCDDGWWRNNTGDYNTVSNKRDLVYVTYTSGSTGIPKGVMIELQSMVNILHVLFHTYPFTVGDCYLFKTSVVFDVSVTELFGWFWGWGRLIILPVGEEKEPLAILDGISRFGISHINFVPSMFSAFLLVLNPENIRLLSTVKYIFLAGEALKTETVKLFKKHGGNTVLENLYGPTEAAIYSSGYSLKDWRDSDKIPIGRPLENVKLYILDKYFKMQPAGIAGELVIGGIGVARGYLNKPELTSEVFCFLPGNVTGSSGENRNIEYQKVYRSGDLACWLADGCIEFLGRIDHQVKVRGYRIELGEIEEHLLRHPNINDAVVVLNSKDDGDNYLSAYFVSAEDIQFQELQDYLLNYLPDYMIPSYVIRLAKMPVTSAGKINRKALPDPEVQSGETYISSRNPIEEKLVEIWADVLDIQKDKIGIADNFFRLGGHSLKAALLTARIHKAFNVNLRLSDIFKLQTIKGLSGYICSLGKTIYNVIPAVERKEYYMLSSAQKRIYVLQQMNTEGTAYNIPSAWILEGVIEPGFMKDTIEAVILRHESLRTSFKTVNNEPVQRVHDKVMVEVSNHSVTVEGAVPAPNSFIRPFDLTQAPLVRIGLVELASQKYLFWIDIHHIIADGVSLQVLLSDFSNLCHQNQLPGMSIHYKDFTEWQNSDAGINSLKQQGEFWRKKFADYVPVLELPTDFIRPPVFDFEGDTFSFEFNEETVNKLKIVTMETGTTMYMVMLALYTILLSKLSCCEDIIVGTPVAGRRHADLEKTIGMFVNTLPLRNYPFGDKPFAFFLQEIKNNLLNAFENQEYPYEDLINDLSIRRELDRNPLFDTMFILQNIGQSELKLPGIKTEPYEFKNLTSKFDLNLVGYEFENRLIFQFEYSVTLFKPETIERFVVYYKKLLYSIIKNREQLISQLEIVPEEEKKRLLYHFNSSEEITPASSFLHRLVEMQVEKTPDYVAIIGPSIDKIGKATASDTGMNLTYFEFNRLSGQLAFVLKQAGMAPDCIASIMVERSVEMIIGLLGILKSGGAYMPVSPDNPKERTNFMLKDSGAVLLLRKSPAPDMSWSVDLLDKDCEELLSTTKTFELNLKKYPSGESSGSSGGQPLLQPSNLAYVIYTSGTTGRPKAVLVEHRNVTGVVNWFATTNFLKANLRVLQMSEYTFDASVNQIFGSLISGATLYLIDNNLRTDLDGIRAYILKHKINLIHFVPTFLRELLCYSDRLACLHSVVSGADKLDESTKQMILDKGYRLVNQYGPTETTIDALAMECTSENVSLGKPIYNAAVYILDNYGNLLPVGVIGELYIGGAIVSRGYLNRPELTFEKFVINPLLGKRLYRSGDLVRWLSTGNVEILGRMDFQVKIRGYRVELGEIETHLVNYPGIREVVVHSATGANGIEFLCAYIVSDAEFSDSDLKHYLSALLPDYMIPARYIRLDKLPLTANSKIDRKALPVPKLEIGENYIAPRNEVEELLVMAWAEVLGLEQDKISITDNFFDLGGDSMKIIRLSRKLENTFDKPITVLTLFRYTTIGVLSEYLSEADLSVAKTIDNEKLAEVEESIMETLDIFGEF